MLTPKLQHRRYGGSTDRSTELTPKTHADYCIKLKDENPGHYVAGKHRWAFRDFGQLWETFPENF